MYNICKRKDDGRNIYVLSLKYAKFPRQSNTIPGRLKRLNVRYKNNGKINNAIINNP